MKYVIRFVILEKGIFKLRRKQIGEEEAKVARKRRKASGEWTPSQERLREMGRRRREEQEPPEF